MLSSSSDTIVTATTRGSVWVTRIPSRASEEDVLHEGVEESGILSETAMCINSEEFGEEGHHSLNNQPLSEPAPRSGSQSPLTVQSYVGTQSIAESASQGPSVLSTAAVAPSSRSFGTRRVNAAAANVNTEVTMGHQVGGSRSMANRVVSFTHTAGFQENIPDQRSNMAARNQPSQEND